MNLRSCRLAMQLLEPLRLGTSGVVAPNRVMFGPHETNLGSDRSVGGRHVAYYQRRAAGGAGLIVTEEASVHESDWPYERCPLASQCGPGWESVAAAIGATGTGSVVLAAIGHSGGQGNSAFSQRELWAPSAVPEVASREVPKVMEQAEIDAVVAGFGSAARLAMRSGLSGVEVNAGQFSMIRQFLSGLTNMRADEYGSDRTRFAREVLAAVRHGVGAQGIVGLRLSVDELAPWAGIVPEAGAAIAVELAGFVDLITVVRGSIFSTWATRPDGHVEPGFGIDLARTVREALAAAGHGDIAVVAQGSIVDANQAEWALESGAADAVEMTRAQLADAELVAKLRRSVARDGAGGAATVEGIRPCLLCNQTCKVRDNRNPIVTCVVDPRSGHELTEPCEPGEPSQAEVGSGLTRTRVTVVGGGVAGLECARVLARRGSDVTVIEQSNRVGGMAVIASRGSGRGRLAVIAEWLEAECRRLGVSIETGRVVRAADLAALAADRRVVLCTGGRDGELPFAIEAGAQVLHAAAVLAADDPNALLRPGPVAVWDPIGGPIAISVAESLADAGRTVVLITPDLLVGEKLSLTGDLAPAQGRLHGRQIVLHKRALVRHVSSSAVAIEDRFGGGATEIEAVALIACGHRLPDDLVDDEASWTRAGDAVAPRTIHEAILEGRRVAMAVPIE